MRQDRQSAALAGLESSCGASSTSPQRAHTGPLWTGNSAQQTSQIGTVESRGRGEPQRVQKAGRSAQPNESMGLRSTRATARHREVSDGGTASVNELESLRKTHLTWRRRNQNLSRLGDSIPAQGWIFHGISTKAVLRVNLHQPHFGGFAVARTEKSAAENSRQPGEDQDKSGDLIHAPRREEDRFWRCPVLNRG